MRAIADAGANDSLDPTYMVIDAVRKSLADLDTYPISDLTDDIEMAETIGRVKALAGVLLSVIWDDGSASRFAARTGSEAERGDHEEG